MAQEETPAPAPGKLQPGAAGPAAAIAPRGSPVARAALLAYFLLIVYASWFPFSGWHDNGMSPFSYLNLVKQRYWTGFDAGVNVVGYMPLGALMVLSLYPRVRGIWALLLGIVGSILVSGSGWVSWG